MSSEMIPIAQIVRDADLQPRIPEDRGIVRKYADALKDGAQFPPVVVFQVNGTLLLADGFHRVSAHRLDGRSEILAEIRQGTRDEALCYALEFNAIHGPNFSRADMQRAVLTYLNHPTMQHWTDREIALRLGISHRTVGARSAALSDAPTVAKPKRGGQVAQAVPPERAKQTRARTLIASDHAAVDALTEAEGVDQVQAEIIKWRSAVSGGGSVKFGQPTKPHRSTKVARP